MLELPKGRIDPELIIEHHIRLSADLGLNHAERNELDRARAVGLSQWQTMPSMAARMVEIAGLAGMDRPMVLEPSAGGGALVAAVRAACPDAHITAHEIDPVYAERLRKAPKSERADVVHRGDFLGYEVPSRPYDVAILNSPYEGGADGAFLARCMDASHIVVALVRLNALTGVGRYDLVWSRCQDEEPEGDAWALAELEILKGRPDFVGPGEDSAKSDYAIVKLCRSPVPVPITTRVRWA